MATADIEEYVSEKNWGHTLFSKQYCGQLIIQVVKIDGVVQKFIDSRTISEAERKSLRDKKVADQKLKRLLTIITDHCNRDDLQAFKTFIDILGDTNNVDIGKQLSLIYKERVNHVATLSRLSKEQSLVEDLKKKISHLERILEEKERYIESVGYENKKLVDHYRKVADDQEKTSREEKLSLENQIQKKEENLLIVEKEIQKLTRAKHDLENEVEHKSNVIRERGIEIEEKEQKIREAIEESNRLRLIIDTHQQQHSETMVEDLEMSKKIEVLESEIDEKEKTIKNLRKNKTMRWEEIEEEFGKITKCHGKKLEVQEEKLDNQTGMIKQLNEHINSLTASAKQQNEKFDLLTDTLMEVLKSQN